MLIGKVPPQYSSDAEAKAISAVTGLTAGFAIDDDPSQVAMNALVAAFWQWLLEPVTSH